MPSQKQPCTIVRLQVEIAAEARKRLLPTFSSLAAQLRGQPGCTSSLLLEDLQEPGHLTLEQTWRSEEMLERFVRSRAFGLLMTGLDLTARPPEVEVRTPTGSFGMEYFERVMTAAEEDEIATKGAE